MSYQQKDGTGSLFKNARKEADTHADYNGTATIDGVEYYVDAWINASKDGQKYMSLKFKPKQPKQPQQQATQRRPAPPEDIPF